MTRNVALAIGGIGGSGTRVVAEVLKQCGFFMGDDLNTANDNLSFTLLFKRPEILTTNLDEFHKLVSMFQKVSTTNSALTLHELEFLQHLINIHHHGQALPKDWLAERVRRIQHRMHYAPAGARWGWKEPNTHIVLDKLWLCWPELKYIHVIRHGLDMALSANQNQLRLWGPSFLCRGIADAPNDALKYWRRVHERILLIAKQRPDQFYLLNYDELCHAPHDTLQALRGFLEVSLNDAWLTRLAALVQTPGTVGRYQTVSPDAFDYEDVEYVKMLGYDVKTAWLHHHSAWQARSCKT